MPCAAARRVEPRVASDDAALPADTVVRAGVVATIVLVCAQTAADLTNSFVLEERFHALDASAEGNPPTWFAVTATSAGAVIAALHAVVFRAERIVYAIAAAGLAYLSVDDSIQVHERLGRLDLGLPPVLQARLDVALIFPVLAVTLASLVVLARRSPAPTSSLLWLGAAALVAGVVFDELVAIGTEPLEQRGVIWPQQLKDAAEEAFELTGALLVTTALAADLVRRLAVPPGRDAGDT